MGSLLLSLGQPALLTYALMSTSLIRDGNMLSHYLAQSSERLHGTCSIWVWAASEHVILLMHRQPRATVSWLHGDDLLSAAKLLGCAVPPSCPQHTHGSICMSLSGQRPLPKKSLHFTPMQLGSQGGVTGHALAKALSALHARLRGHSFP